MAHERGDFTAIRESWGRDVPDGTDLLFFVGGLAPNLKAPWLLDKDVVSLPSVSDDYDSLPEKTREILKRALNWGYSHVFLADCDTFIIPKKLLALPFQRYDLAGRFGKIKPIGETFRYIDGRDIVYDPCWPWPSGGCGYFVSRNLAEYVIRQEPKIWAEDMWLGQLAGPLEKEGYITIGDLENLECQAAWHFPRWRYNQEVYHPRFGWQEKMYREHNENSDLC